MQTSFVLSEIFSWSYRHTRTLPQYQKYEVAQKRPNLAPIWNLNYSSVRSRQSWDVSSKTNFLWHFVRVMPWGVTRQIIKWVFNSCFVEQWKQDELNYLICGHISTGSTLAMLCFLCTEHEVIKFKFDDLHADTRKSRLYWVNFSAGHTCTLAINCERNLWLSAYRRLILLPSKL